MDFRLDFGTVPSVVLFVFHFITNARWCTITNTCSLHKDTSIHKHVCIQNHKFNDTDCVRKQAKHFCYVVVVYIILQENHNTHGKHQRVACKNIYYMSILL